MNKLLLTFSLVLLTTFSFAQTFDFGIKAGVNLSTASVSGPPPVSIYDHPDHQYKTGFQAGVTADIGFQHFSIQPGLFFITKGEKFREDLAFLIGGQPNSTYETVSTNFNYLELPVNLLYKLQAAPAVRIYAGGGPYLGYGLSGKTTVHVRGDETHDSQANAPFGSENTSEYKSLDYGANFIAGVALKKHFTVDLNYSLGLRNIAWTPGNGLKNRTLGLSVGYLF
jgi:hypothetical protein